MYWSPSVAIISINMQESEENNYSERTNAKEKVKKMISVLHCEMKNTGLSES